MCVVVLGSHVYAVRHPGGEFLSQGGAKSLRAGAVRRSRALPRLSWEEQQRRANLTVFYNDPPDDKADG